MYSHAPPTHTLSTSPPPSTSRHAYLTSLSYSPPHIEKLHPTHTRIRSHHPITYPLPFLTHEEAHTLFLISHSPHHIFKSVITSYSALTSLLCLHTRKREHSCLIPPLPFLLFLFVLFQNVFTSLSIYTLKKRTFLSTTFLLLHYIFTTSLTSLSSSSSSVSFPPSHTYTHTNPQKRILALVKMFLSESPLRPFFVWLRNEAER